MEGLRKKVKQAIFRRKLRKAFKNRQPIDWSNTKPPTELAVYKMIRNLHAAGTDADNSPKRYKSL